MVDLTSESDSYRVTTLRSFVCTLALLAVLILAVLSVYGRP
jgi:hypothetical protein